LQGITSKPVEKSWIGLFCSCLPVRDLIGGEILENWREEDGGGEGGGVSNGRRGRWNRPGSSCALEVVIPRTRAALLHSARVGAALMSGGERETIPTPKSRSQGWAYSNSRNSS